MANKCYQCKAFLSKEPYRVVEVPGYKPFYFCNPQCLRFTFENMHPNHRYYDPSEYVTDEDLEKWDKIDDPGQELLDELTETPRGEEFYREGGIADRIFYRALKAAWNPDEYIEYMKQGEAED